MWWGGGGQRVCCQQPPLMSPSGSWLVAGGPTSPVLWVPQCPHLLGGADGGLQATLGHLGPHAAARAGGVGDPRADKRGRAGVQSPGCRRLRPSLPSKRPSVSPEGTPVTDSQADVEDARSSGPAAPATRPCRASLTGSPGPGQPSLCPTPAPRARGQQRPGGSLGGGAVPGT